MNPVENNRSENTVTVINEITKLVQDIEKKVSMGCLKVKECEELKLLKEKCCNSNVIISSNAFYGIRNLVERKILVESQTVSMLISLLPSIKEYSALVSTIGSVLLFDIQAQISENKIYKSPYSRQYQHPFITVLNYNREKSWFEVYHFVLQLMRVNEDIKLESKIEFLRPVFRHVFWSPSWQGSIFQQKLFDILMVGFSRKQIMNFALESLLWQELDIYYCLFLQDFFIHLLESNVEKKGIVICGLTPSLALAIKWLILNGQNPNFGLKLLKKSIEIDGTSGSAVLFILTDVIMETPSTYINTLIDVCKSIILSSNCSKYVAHKFVSVTLNWFVSPSFLANPVYKTLEEILGHINGQTTQWKDQTLKVNDNVYYRTFGNSKKEVKFALELLLLCNEWKDKKELILVWLKNLGTSNERKILLSMHSFISGILLCESDVDIVNSCLDLLFKLIELEKEISFSLLCLLFYKLGKETNPNLQKIYLFSMPKLAVKKENIPLILGIIESLKGGYPKIIIPVTIQLYLMLWKYDKRTYSYLHKILHDNTMTGFTWEANVSKALALKEICRLDPHLHAKDLVAVLSKILNDCSSSISGLPSAIAIDAVTELCKAYVIDVLGTWNAIQPKLRSDKRPEVIISLCKFFKEIPNLDSSEKVIEELVKDILPMLWNYTFSKNSEVVKSSFLALSNFPIEKLPLKFIPEVYRENVKLPKDLAKELKNPEDVLQLPYVPAECWIQFLGKVEEEFLADGGKLVTALVERELNSLPRGIFYHPSEKPEPLNYSYLPSSSICRGLVELLQKHSRENPSSSPEYVKEIIHVLSKEYSKLLPAINWTFLESLMRINKGFLRNCLVLLAKQGSVSVSARFLLEKYFNSVKWDSDTLDDILFIFNLLPVLRKGFSYNILQNFLEQTLKLCLQVSLSQNTPHFEKILENLTEVLKNQAVQPGHKNLIAKQLIQILVYIPPEHEVMQKFAMCATEFPVKLVEEISSIKDMDYVYSVWLRRAVVIRCAIAMRSDISNPLVWLNDFTEAAVYFPNEQNFVLKAIWSIIRSRRDCDHRNWIQELTWRIQASITSSSSFDTNEVTLFFIDVFIAVVIILSGHDNLFLDVDEFLDNELKRLELFPQSLCTFLSLPDWIDMLPKMGTWCQRLSQWRELPQDKVKVLLQAILTLRGASEAFKNANELYSLFHLLSIPSI